MSVTPTITKVTEFKSTSETDESGRTIGAFLFFGKSKLEATVLNVLCEAGREFEVVGQMFSHLDAEGYVHLSQEPGIGVDINFDHIDGNLVD